MIDFYALTSPNVQKIYIMLEETKLPYKEHFVDVWKGDQYSSDFIKVNPNSKIPAIVDHDGPGGKPITIFESGAILMYLAEKSGKFLPSDMAKKYEVLQWLMIQLTGVGPSFGQFTHFKMFAPKDKDHTYSTSRHHTEVKRLYEVLEKRLGQAKYLGGDEYSIADIATFPWTRNHDMQGVKWEDNPEPRALVQGDRRAPGGEGRAGQGRPDQIEPRNRERRSEGSLLQSRQVRTGVVRFSRSSALQSPPRENGEGRPHDALPVGGALEATLHLTHQNFLAPPAAPSTTLRVGPPPPLSRRGRMERAFSFSRCTRIRVGVTPAMKSHERFFARRTDLRQMTPAVVTGASRSGFKPSARMKA